MKQVLCVFFCILLTACGENVSERVEGEMYRQITVEETKQMMDGNAGAVILDVRGREAFDAGHIPAVVSGMLTLPPVRR